MSDANRLEPEYREHYLAYRKDPSPAAAGALLRAVSPIIDTGVRTYGGGDSPLLRSHARKIVLDSLPAYNPARASMRTHLMSQLRGLQRTAGWLDQPLSVPEQVMLDHHRLHTATSELRDQLGREPSTQEISDHARMSPKRMSYVRQYRPGVAQSQVQNQFRTVGGEDDGGYEPAVVHDSARQYAELLYPHLEPRDQVVLEHSAGLFGKPAHSHREIAKILGVTPGAVTQRAKLIQQRLDQLSGLELI